MRWPITILVALLLSSASSAETLSELLTKYQQAVGGLPALKSMNALELKGRFFYQSGTSKQEFPYRTLLTRKGELRNELSIQGLTAINVYRAKSGGKNPYQLQDGWRVAPFGGRKDPERLSNDEAKSLAWDADLDGPLVEYQSKGLKLDYLGQEDMEGTPAHKIRIVRSDGDWEILYLDPDYYLPIRIQRTSVIRGAESVEEIDFGNYQKVDGVYFPFVIEMGEVGATKKRGVFLDTIVVNPKVEAKVFEFPKEAK